jgi:gas vesicle protein
MKEKILTLVIGILIGAIITTAGFLIYNKSVSSTQPEMMKNMDKGQMDKPQNGDNGEAPTKPDGDNGEEPPAKPDDTETNS